MSLLALKLVLTPVLIGLASLAGRRWGHAVSGWLVALPLTTGPIVFFLAFAHGPMFAAQATMGILAGCVSLAVFTTVYARLALRASWFPTLAASSLAFFVMTAALSNVDLPPLPVWIVALASLAIAYNYLPRSDAPTTPAGPLPGRWDIPLRMFIATGFVLAITSLAPALGPRLAGLVSPFPLFTAILAAFAQHRNGAPAAVSVLRGLLLGLLSYACFMFTLALSLVTAGTVAAFGLAILVVIVIQALTLRFVRHGIR